MLFFYKQLFQILQTNRSDQKQADKLSFFNLEGFLKHLTLEICSDVCLVSRLPNLA